MTKEELKTILEQHKLWLNNKTGERADLQDANLQGANLQGANLRSANLQDANLQDANLQDAILRGVNLQGANLQVANLRGANLRGANLRGAFLQGANLQDVNLQDAILCDANLDFSCWPLWCGGLNVKVDKRLAVQIAYHFCALECNDKEFQEVRQGLLAFANRMHRIDVDRLE